jgi:hypothetical protein
MNHFSEAELIELYYGESSPNEEWALHLAGCAQCSAAYAALAEDLARVSAEMDSVAVPERGDAYGESVWGALRPSLVAYERPRLGMFRLPRLAVIWSFAAAVVVLAVVAFYSGRLWEQRRGPATIARGNGAASNAGQAQQVILLVLSDHLDRSERLLVELNHPEEAAVDSALQTTARQLLDENRRYRLSTARSGAPVDSSSGTVQNGQGITSTVSPAVIVTLDDLDRLLAEIAGSRGGLSRAEIARVQKEMNTSGLLFEVRILRSRVRNRQPGVAVARQGGTIS